MSSASRKWRWDERQSVPPSRGLNWSRPADIHTNAIIRQLYCTEIQFSKYKQLLYKEASTITTIFNTEIYLTNKLGGWGGKLKIRPRILENSKILPFSEQNWRYDQEFWKTGDQTAQRIIWVTLFVNKGSTEDKLELSMDQNKQERMVVFSKAP